MANKFFFSILFLLSISALSSGRLITNRTSDLVSDGLNNDFRIQQQVLRLNPLSAAEACEQTLRLHALLNHRIRQPISNSCFWPSHVPRRYLSLLRRRAIAGNSWPRHRRRPLSSHSRRSSGCHAYSRLWTIWKCGNCSKSGFSWSGLTSWIHCHAYYCNLGNLYCCRKMRSRKFCFRKWERY